jgi:hypothetical protein
MAYTIDDFIRKYSFHGSQTFRIKGSASSLISILRRKEIVRRAEAAILDPVCVRKQDREVCELQLMVLSSPHRIDDLLRQAFNKAVMGFEMVQKLSFRQERRIASFAPTDGATEVTDLIRHPSVLIEHVRHNLLTVMENRDANSGASPAILHGAKSIELVLSVFNVLQPFILPLECPSAGPALLVRTTKDPSLGMLGIDMTLQITDTSKWSLE